MSGNSGSSSSSPTKPSRLRTSNLAPPSPNPSRPSLSRSPSSATFTPPLHLTIRFSTSLPDLQLDVQSPAHTTVASLKHTIRSRLAAPYASRRLRFIHAGKILPDGSALGAVLRVPPPPPRSFSASSPGEDPKGKGKAVEGRDGPMHRVYVNCSIGDELTAEELEDEATAAKAPVASRSPSTSGRAGGRSTGMQLGSTSGVQAHAAAGSGGGGSAASRTPRGFDRLLSAGFTAAEVNQLRLQFRSIQAARYTPDTMPSPDSLRTMEDAWIDNNNAGMSGVGGGAIMTAGSGDDGAGGADMDEFHMLDIMIRGMIIGFMWPLGFIGWLVREEGLWSQRWKVFASFGFVLSLTIGAIRAISGDR